MGAARAWAAYDHGMVSETPSIRSASAALLQEMALQEERMNTRLDRQTTRMTLLAAGLAGLILTAIGIASGILATL